jgi:hypothetical protein
MKTLKNKIAAITISIFFILSMTASLTLIPNANAQTLAPGKIDIQTYAYVAANPGPAGVGQTINIGFWLDIPPLDANAQYGDRWQNLMLTITGPSGNTKLGPFTSDPTGGTYTDFTPTAVGTYTVSFSFPGQILAGNNLAPGTQPDPYIGDYFEPSNATTTLTVQQTPVSSVPQAPLPATYWTRPIESVNSYWSSISGNWLSLAGNGNYNASGSYAPYTTAPTSAHILWTELGGAPGGLIGGEFGGTDTSNFNAPQQYQPKFAPIIMNGVLYYEMIPGSSQNPTGWAAINLKTGQTVWTKTQPTGQTNGPILKCGQLLDFHTPDQYGAMEYLWATGNPLGNPTLTGVMCSVPAPQQTVLNGGAYVPVTTTLTGTTFSIYDALTGNYIFSIVNDTYGMTLTEDAAGNLIGYFVNMTNPNVPMLEMWNSTLDVMNYETGAPSNAWIWEPAQNEIIPWAAGIQWQAPIATNLNGVPFPSSTASFTFATVPGSLGISGSCIEDGVILMTCSSTVSAFQTGFQIEAGYSMANGAQLWITNRTETPETRLVMLPATAGVYGEVNCETGVLNGYSMTTGTLVWGPITLPDQDAYTSIGGYRAIAANGTDYLYGFGGTIYAINMATGALLWTTDTTQLLGPAGANTPYGVWPLWTSPPAVGGAVAGGVLFVPVGHSYTAPMFRGAQLLAINCTNGHLVWSDMGFDLSAPCAVSDGIAIEYSSYDNSIYAYGQGPSKTAISAPQVGITTATPITLIGSVTDISAGSQQNAVAMNFPNGLPCVSDASMTPFMEAVYQQQPMPTNVTGVTVALYVLDHNNNYRSIGTTTTNALGDYSFTWTPDIPGNYTVYATFAGTQSYYASSASTGFYAGNPAATAAPTATPLSGVASNTTLMYGIIAIIIVIVIIGALIMLMLSKKRP